MEKQTIEFEAPGNQVLKRVSPLRTFASDTINYIEAYFNLSDEWAGYNERVAVWYTERVQKGSAIDADGKTVIPQEVLTQPGILKMNLCFNYIENDKLTARNTSYPVEVLKLVHTNV